MRSTPCASVFALLPSPHQFTTPTDEVDYQPTLDKSTSIAKTRAFGNDVGSVPDDRIVVSKISICSLAPPKCLVGWSTTRLETDCCAREKGGLTHRVEIANHGVSSNLDALTPRSHRTNRLVDDAIRRSRVAVEAARVETVSTRATGR